MRTIDVAYQLWGRVGVVIKVTLDRPPINATEPYRITPVIRWQINEAKAGVGISDSETSAPDKFKPLKNPLTYTQSCDQAHLVVFWVFVCVFPFGLTGD